MFTTLLGPLPRPPLASTAAPEAVLDAVLETQAQAGLEPLTDGGWPLRPADPVASWRAATARTGRAVKAVVQGPFSARVGPDGGATRPAPTRAGARRETANDDAVVARLRRVILDLGEAGCPFIEIHEPAAVAIGADGDARDRFRDLHERLLDRVAGAAGLHLSLAITGGSADTAGVDTILGQPYDSLAVDLIAGPDNWRLVAAAPPERGIICGAVSAQERADDAPEILLWAVAYAASGARGLARVGLATASSLVDRSWDVVLARLAALQAASELVALPEDERRASLDPRAVDIRSAAFGRYRRDRGERLTHGPPAEPRT